MSCCNNGAVGMRTIDTLSGSTGRALWKRRCGVFPGFGSATLWRDVLECQTAFRPNCFELLHCTGGTLNSIFPLTTHPTPTCWVRAWAFFLSEPCAPGL